MVRSFCERRQRARDFWLTLVGTIIVPPIVVGVLNAVSIGPWTEERYFFLAVIWTSMTVLGLFVCVADLSFSRQGLIVGKQSIASRRFWGRCRRMANGEVVRVIWLCDRAGVARIESPSIGLVLMPARQREKPSSELWLIRELRTRFGDRTQENWAEFADRRALPLRQSCGEDVYGEPHCREHAWQDSRLRLDRIAAGFIALCIGCAGLEYWLGGSFSVAVFSAFLTAGWLVVRRGIPVVGSWYRKPITGDYRLDFCFAIAACQMLLLEVWLGFLFLWAPGIAADGTAAVVHRCLGFCVAAYCISRLYRWLTRSKRARELAVRHAWAVRRWEELESRTEQALHPSAST